MPNLSIADLECTLEKFTPLLNAFKTEAKRRGVGADLSHHAQGFEDLANNLPAGVGRLEQPGDLLRSVVQGYGNLALLWEGTDRAVRAIDVPSGESRGGCRCCNLCGMGRGVMVGVLMIFKAVAGVLVGIVGAYVVGVLVGIAVIAYRQTLAGASKSTPHGRRLPREPDEVTAWRD